MNALEVYERPHLPQLALEVHEREYFLNLDREKLHVHQLARLNQLLEHIRSRNGFYAVRLAGINPPLQSLDELTSLPFTYKHELISDRGDGFATNRTYPLEQYGRYHRTSGTRGRPLAVVDTAADWEWWISIWQFVLDAARIESRDRVALAFSFGPFIGFWSAHDAIARRGAMLIPLGGMDTRSRLELIHASQATVLCCTPTYALRLAEVAGETGFDCRTTDVSRIIISGEPGGSLPAVRNRIESAWDARVIDHAGATEVGPWGFADAERTGLHIAENEFIAEFLQIDWDGSLSGDDRRELVLTTLGRYGCPVIRYRTGDIVRAPKMPTDGAGFVLLEGGVFGRVDDMVVIRGVNIYPSAVEQIMREFPSVAEYRAIVKQHGEMSALEIEVEDQSHQPERIASELKIRLGLSIQVTEVSAGTLPRSEGKGQRFLDERTGQIAGKSR